MKTALMIKDLAIDTELSVKQMASVRGGMGNQANGTSQFNVMEALTSHNVANGAVFAGCAPVIIQADTSVDQHGSNDNTSDNYKLFGMFGRAAE